MGRSLTAHYNSADEVGERESGPLTVLILSRVNVQCAVNTVRNRGCHQDDGYASVQNSSRKNGVAVRWSDIDLSWFSVHVDSYRCDAGFPKSCAVVLRNEVGIPDFAWIGDIIRGMPANPQ